MPPTVPRCWVPSKSGVIRSTAPLSVRFASSPRRPLVIDDDIPDGGTFVGPDGVRAYMSRFLEPWETLTIEPESIEQSGDTFLVHVLQKGTGRGSQASAEMRYAQLWTFVEGKVVRIESRLSGAT